MNSNIQNIKQRFEIVGIDPGLDRAIEKAIRVSFFSKTEKISDLVCVINFPALKTIPFAINF